MNSLLFYWLLAVLFFVLTVVLLSSLSIRFPRLGFYSRLLLSWASLVVCACYGVIASIILRIVGYGGLSQWTVARSFKWTMYIATGVEFVVQNEEYLKTRPAVFVGNHQTFVVCSAYAQIHYLLLLRPISSELDVLMLGEIFPKYCSVTAKKSLKYIPFLGWFMALSKTVFIDRGNRETARLAFESAARQMKQERQSVFIFPEGTRSYATRAELLPFKKGAFHLAIQAQVPIVPIVVANYSNVLHVQSRTFTAGKIPVRVLPPISTDNLTPQDVDNLMQSTRDQMLDELITLTEVARSQKVALSASQARLLEDHDNDAVKATGRQKISSLS